MGETRRQNNSCKFPFSFFTLFFLTVLIILTLKNPAKLRTQNWLLCKENAALKKSIKNNVVEADFVDQVANKEDMLVKEEGLMVLGLPDPDYMFQVLVVWYSPDVTPCHMGWLMDRLFQHIYGEQNMYH
jgi:hypothetical protein